MNVDDACAFFKELAIKHRVPVEMWISVDGSIWMRIPKLLVVSTTVSEIMEEAEKRGMTVHPNEDRIILSG